MIRADQEKSASTDTSQLDIKDIIRHRVGMVRSVSKVGVHDAKNPGKVLDAARAIAMSCIPVETEASFWKAPSGTIRFDGVMSPSGPSALIKDVEIISNPSVPRKVDAMVDDTAVGAVDAARELYSAEVDVGYISRLLSLGLLGRKRKLVPTRWSITASDDMIGKSLKDGILDMPAITSIELYSGELLGNRFEIILLPRSFSFELIEIWLSRSVWSPEETWIGSDREGPEPKKDYSGLAGGYYAARLAVLERLHEMGRQATALALREITEAYWAPLGVWVVRDAARKAMASVPKRCGSLQEAIAEAEGRMRTKAAEWRGHSSLGKPAQATLTGFLQQLEASRTA
jgi:hypothetical protein